MELSKEFIKKFMKEMGLKLFFTPSMYGDGSIGISLKVKNGEKTEYHSYCYFIRTSDGGITWRARDIEIGADDGIFSYLNDDDSVNNFFLDISKKFAKSCMDEKLKS